MREAARKAYDEVLNVEHASCAVGARTIFSDVALTVRPGQRLHVTGVNGAGKTALLRCIGGTMALTSGTADVGGHRCGSFAARALTGMCVEPEKGLYLTLSGRQNLQFAARLRVRRHEVSALVDRVERELGTVGFAHDKVLHYSAGMRARIAVARALLGSPALVLLDEPTRSLDEAGRDMLWAALDARPAAAVVLTSHLPSDRDRCDLSVAIGGPA